MPKGKVILDSHVFGITLSRLAHQLIEKYGDFSGVSFIGIQEKGVILALRIIEVIKAELPDSHIEFGKLDITFYRDDFRMRDVPLKANSTEIDFLVENKEVILIDDVVYTGRTIQAAMSALQDFGRPAQVELLCMVDRRFNRHLPIQTNYSGLKVDSIDEAYVRVQWSDVEGEDQVLIFSGKNEDS